MRLIYIFSLIFLLFIISCSRTNNVDITPVLKEKEARFPDDWFGIWEGKLDIYNAQGKVQSIKMGMEIQKTDTLGSYGWKIIYGDDIRSYYLLEIDPEKGHYQMDEKNSILLNSYLLGNRLVSTYEVMGNTITTSYTLKDSQLIFEVYASNSKKSLDTGGSMINDEEIPVVKSYQSTGYQRATLNKIKIGQKNTLSN